MLNKNDNLFKNYKTKRNNRLYLICYKKLFGILINGKPIKTLIIKIIDIILLLIILYIIGRDNLNIYYNKNHIDYQKFLEVNYEPLNIAFNNSINFINSCQSPELIHFQSSIDYNFNNPKISVVIPLFNCERFILRAIKSIQLQNLSDFEIILIDDNSLDNTYNSVSIYQKEDNRIKILKNQKNMGTLYSRSIGVLMSKGKYLFNLDNDDLFLNNDIFYTRWRKIHCYLLKKFSLSNIHSSGIIVDTFFINFIKCGISHISEKGNFDIVEFKSISNKKKDQNILSNKIKNSIFSHQKPFILFQPELGMFPIPTGNIIGSYTLHDIFLWGKCIKTKIYQKALNNLGYERYSRLMIRYEDIVTNYMIFNTAESFLYIEKYGIYHFVRTGSGTSIGRKKVSRNINLLYLIDIVIDFSLNNVNNKKLAAYLIIYYLKLRRIKETLTSSKYYMNLFISCLRRVFNSTFISRNNKNEIRNILKRLKYIRFH